MGAGACICGSSVPPLPGDVMMNMDYDPIREAGSLLGSGAVVVMDETTSMVSMLRRIAHFHDPRSSRGQAHHQARRAIFEFIEGWYNPHHRHRVLGQQSPMAFERSDQDAA